MSPPGMNRNLNIPDQSVLEMLAAFFNQQKGQAFAPGTGGRSGPYGQIGGRVGGFSPGVNASIGTGGVGLGVGANFQGDGFNIGGNVDVGGLLNMIGQSKFKDGASKFSPAFSGYPQAAGSNYPVGSLAKEGINPYIDQSLDEAFVPALGNYSLEGAATLVEPAAEGATALATEGVAALTEEELLNTILGMIPMF